MGYNESLDPNTNAAAIQTAVRTATGMNDLVVQAVDADDYLVNFGDASLAKPEPLFVVGNFNFSGFLPSVDVSMVREPGTTQNIPISNNPGEQTAQNIQYAFQNDSQSVPIAPVQFNGLGPYSTPGTLRTALPAVSVTANSATEFDVTFTGNSGMEQQPLLSLLDSSGNPLVGPGVGVQILKQTSDAFRVNDPEPQDPDALRPQFYDQTNPQVAMDLDGDFVITWQSAVPYSVNPGSDSDIFARRFSPAAYGTSTFYADMNHDGQIDASDPLIEGVRPLGSQFQVNTMTANPQTLPSVGMDNAGNFTIAWQSIGQGLSFFNTISAQRYDHYGNPIGTEFIVNTPDNTTDSLYPYVAMSGDGVIAVTWTNTSDPSWLLNGSYTAAVLAKVYDAHGNALPTFDPAGVQLSPTLSVGGGGLSTATFDSGDNLAIAWEVVADTDNIGTTTTGSFVREYGPVTGGYAATPIRDMRANSAVRRDHDSPLHKRLLAGRPSAPAGGYGRRRRHDGFLHRIRA